MRIDKEHHVQYRDETYYRIPDNIKYLDKNLYDWLKIALFLIFSIAGFLVGIIVLWIFPHMNDYFVIPIMVALFMAFSHIIPQSIREKKLLGHRICPNCKKEMEKFIPQKKDFINTYQYFCRTCFVYIDTNYKNIDPNTSAD